MILANAVLDAVNQASVVDLHTHLFAPQFPSLSKWGIDEILTYHYLVAEYLRATGDNPAQFFAMPKEMQADRVWEELFVRRSPISEAAAGVVTILTVFDLSATAPDLREARAFFNTRNLGLHIRDVMKISGVETITMTNDPLDPSERPYWDSTMEPDLRFQAALRIDPILNTWSEAVPKLEVDGFLASVDPVAAIRGFLDYWIDRMHARYVAVSLPSDYKYPDDSLRNLLIREAVLPTCRERNIPFALMMGVRRNVNPAIGPAGDGMGVSDMTALEHLALEHPENRFLVTALSEANAQDLCVVARKFANVTPFGCWWFTNNPSIVERTTTMRLEMLGTTFIPQHSDARVLEQLIYKWRHARRAIARSLTTRYEALETAGLPVTMSRITRDARLLLGQNAADSLGIRL